VTGSARSERRGDQPVPFHHGVGAALEVDGRLLLVHRSPACAWAPEAWDLPGGHVDDGELEADALIREAREELGITTTIDNLSFLGRLGGPDFDVAYFHVRSWTGTPYNAAPSEHTELAWVSVAGLRQMVLADPDVIPIVDPLLGP
jgi:8-oxo-dGTP diphosphatase